MAPSPAHAAAPRPAAKAADVALTICRWLLAAGMIPYAVSKLCNIQFQLGPERYYMPLGNAPGTILTWAFLGHSPTFQFFMGLFEFVPSVLLCFRRTSRLGAVLLLPVVANVVMINFALNLWRDTRIISSVFLGLNLILLLADWRFFAGLLGRLLESRPSPFQSAWIRIAGRVAACLAVIGIGLFLNAQLFAPMRDLDGQLSDFIGEREINGAGAWTIEAWRVGGVDFTPSPAARLYFNFSKACFYDDGVSRFNALPRGAFTASRAAHTVEISGVAINEDGGPIRGTYRVNGDAVTIDGTRGGRAVQLVLRRRDWGPMWPVWK